eukprot:TRINITY_DN984_c0_g1_i3.p1 TRINITY_DN984_c0_g1~~TRINITY_DN984_c0_g1_i3.p1  ORF type:complete len:361 (+),score=89.62 TRINITY_DN984_c0_g1_i3:100-1182(+)
MSAIDLSPPRLIDSQGMQAEQPIPVSPNDGATISSVTTPSAASMRTYTIFEVKKIIADLRRQQDKANEKYEEERLRMKRALERAKGYISDHKRKDHTGVIDTLKGHIKELNQLRQTDQRTIKELRFSLANEQTARQEREVEVKQVLRRYDEELLRLKLKIRTFKQKQDPRTASPMITTTTTTTTTTTSMLNTSSDDMKPMLKRVTFSPKLVSVAGPPRTPSQARLSLSHRSPRMSPSPYVSSYMSRSPSKTSPPLHPCVHPPRSPKLIAAQSNYANSANQPSSHQAPIYPSRSPRIKASRTITMPRRDSITMAHTQPPAQVYYHPSVAFPVGVPIPLQLHSRSPKTPGSPSPAHLEVLIL